MELVGGGGNWEAIGDAARCWWCVEGEDKVRCSGKMGSFVGQNSHDLTASGSWRDRRRDQTGVCRMRRPRVLSPPPVGSES